MNTRSRSTNSLNMGNETDFHEILSSMNKKLEQLDRLTTIENDLSVLKESFAKQDKLLQTLTCQITALEKENEKQAEQITKIEKEKQELNQKVAVLEEKCDDLEQYSKVDNVIISGLKSQSYAAAVDSSDNRDLPNALETENVQDQVLNLFNKELNLNITKSDISAVHYIKRKNKKRDIVVRFVSRQTKDSVMKNRKKLKGRSQPLYINEHYTEKTAKLAFEARQLVKKGKVAFTWTKNCKVFIKTVGETPEEEKVVLIKNMADVLKLQTEQT